MSRLIEIPAEKGSYALLFSMRRARLIRIGQLGEEIFPAGFYVYFGSAQGYGGVLARTKRYLIPSTVRHWHIDDLLPHVKIQGLWYTITAQNYECVWSQTAFTLLGEQGIVLRGFGASDCRKGCPAHLFRMETVQKRTALLRKLKQNSPLDIFCWKK